MGASVAWLPVCLAALLSPGVNALMRSSGCSVDNDCFPKVAVAANPLKLLQLWSMHGTKGPMLQLAKLIGHLLKEIVTCHHM